MNHFFRRLIRDASLKKKLALLVAAALTVAIFLILPVLAALFCLTSGHHELYRWSQSELVLAILIVIGGLAAATWAFHYLSRIILTPLSELAALMKRAAAEQDYSSRATKSSGDEIGTLAEACNHLLSQMEKAQLEKDRLIEDLHDGAGGIMTNINLTVAAALQAGPSPTDRQLLTAIEELSREGIAEIRRFISCANNFYADWWLLAAEMRRYARNLLDSNRIEFTMNICADDRLPIPGSLFMLNLWRIYNEALNNILKHARARNVAASLLLRTRSLTLEIRDDGIGPGNGTALPGGTANMRRRAAAMGGSLTIEPQVGGGTRVILEVPFDSI